MKLTTKPEPDPDTQRGAEREAEAEPTVPVGHVPTRDGDKSC
jgi:hypothetical protein